MSTIAVERAALPKHLARLPGGQWALWRWVALRGAGFSAEQMLQLADDECVRAARQLIDAEDAAEEVRRQTVAHFKRVEQETDADDVETRTVARKVLRGIWKGKLPRPDDTPSGHDEVVNNLRSAYAHADAMRTNFNKEFERAIERGSSKLHDLASSNLFQEAVIWQNRKAYNNGISSFLRGKPGEVRRNSMRRMNEEVIATYLQRYCTKNDTIGFFGPVGWAKLVSDASGLEIRPGESLLSKRNVHLESWSIDTLTEILTEDESMRRWAAPRLLPFFRVEGTTLHHPFSGSTTVSKEIAAVLVACGGVRAAREIAIEIARDPSLNLNTEEEVFNVLDNLCAEGLILWKFECPVGEQAEQYLIDLIERIGDDDLRADALDLVHELQEARDRVAAAAGNAEKLNKAISALEETFESMTGEVSTRSPGEVYAARTLVYEDCERALDVEIGSDVLEVLGPPLSLLLDSARWFTFEEARRYREIFTRTYAELVKETGTKTVEAVAFWHKVQPHIVARDVHVIRSTMEVFQKRWEAVLSLPENERRVNYTSEELRPRVREQFFAPCAGWRLGRYQCPDVMIAASSAEAIGRGDYQLVMGELHLGGNTLSNSIFVNQHPVPKELIEAYENDMPEPCIIPIPPRRWPTLTARTSLCVVAPKDIRLAISYDAASSLSEPVLPISSFVIEEESSGRLVARTRDGLIEFEIVEFFGAMFSLLSASYFKMLTPRKHTPRVTIDRLVVTREAWRFSAAELEFAHHKEEVNRFAGLQRWAIEYGIPRFVFVKAPLEPKPFYVDLESPILINFFTRTVRQALSGEFKDHPITVTEMIPTPDQLWVTDALGQLYTAELRMVGIEAPV
jgi:hypothetical protein